MNTHFLYKFYFRKKTFGILDEQTIYQTMRQGQLDFKFITITQVHYLDGILDENLHQHQNMRSSDIKQDTKQKMKY